MRSGWREAEPLSKQGRALTRNRQFLHTLKHIYRLLLRREQQEYRLKRPRVHGERTPAMNSHGHSRDQRDEGVGDL